MPHATNGPANGKQQRVFLFTYPRTASHLFMKMLALPQQPALAAYPPEQDEYFFMPALGAEERLSTMHHEQHELSEDDKASLMEMYQGSAKKMQDFIQENEALGKSIFIKEHVDFIINPVGNSPLFGDSTNDVIKSPWTVSICEFPATPQSALNNTLFPDDFLLGWAPTFLIRHPALAFASHFRSWTSMQRAMKSDPDKKAQAIQYGIMENMISIKPMRNLYDFYKQKLDAERADAWPVVIDANDVIHHPEVKENYCQTVGYDTTKMVSEWKEYTEEEQAAISSPGKVFLSTIMNSRGVMKTKAPADISIEVEAKKWQEEFGGEAAQMIERWVREAMPDYEYLLANRVKPNSVTALT